MDIKELFENTTVPEKKKMSPLKVGLIVLIILLVIAGVFIGGYFAGYLKNGISDEGRELLESMPNLEKAYLALKRNYLWFDDLSWEEYQNIVVAGMLGNLDPFSSLYVTDEYQSLQPAIGVTFKRTEYNEYIISKVSKGSPADLAGIKRGDKVYSVNGKRVENIEFSKFSEIVQASNSLNLGIYSQDDDLNYTVPLRNISVTKSVFTAKLAWYEEVNSDTGMIVFTDFSTTAVADFMEAADAFVNAGKKKLILDLRGNGGGSIDIACQIAPMLMKSGNSHFDFLLARIERKDGSTTDYKAKQTSTSGNNSYIGDRVGEGFELAVLTDEGSASASEMLLAAINYYNRDKNNSYHIGTKTYGKGVAQGQVLLDQNYVMYITTAYYYVNAWDGDQTKLINFHGEGLTPNAENLLTNMPITSNMAKDTAIQRALEIFAS